VGDQIKADNTLWWELYPELVRKGRLIKIAPPVFKFDRPSCGYRQKHPGSEQMATLTAIRHVQFKKDFKNWPLKGIVAKFINFKKTTETVVVEAQKKHRIIIDLSPNDFSEFVEII